MPRSIPGANKARGWELGGLPDVKRTGKDILEGFLVDALPVVTRKDGHDEGMLQERKQVSVPEKEA